MERKVNIAKSHMDAEKWDIQQQIQMIPKERQMAAKELKKRFYGNNAPDIRSSKKFSIYYIGLDD